MGFSAGRSLKQALRKARHEQFRFAHNVRHSAPGETKLFERRVRYFSTEEGFATIRERVEKPAEARTAPFRLVFSGEIRGPWSQFARVWRCVFRPPSRRFLSDTIAYPFW